MSNRLPLSGQHMTVSCKVSENKVERFDANLPQMGYKTRSAAIRDFIERNAQAPESQQYLPERDAERSKYETLLSVANQKLIVAPRIVGGELAQQFGVPKNNLPSALIDLRRKGFVAMQAPAPGTEGGPVFRVKPRTADPNQWKYREVF